MNDKKRIPTPTTFEYFDKYKKTKVVLKPKSDELVVTVKKPSDVGAASNRWIENSPDLKPSSKRNQARGVCVINVANDSDSLDVARSLQADDVMNSVPAFEDSDGNTRYFVPDELTVQFEPSITESDAKEIIENLGSSILVKQRTPGYYTISVPEGQELFQTISQFNGLDTVKFSEASEIGFDDAQSTIPNDSRFGELWGLCNTGQVVQGTTGQVGADINVLDAWKITHGDPNVVIAVIDTGMELEHTDLSLNLLNRRGEDWDFAAEDDSPDDEGDHGTHVCGTCAADANNDEGIVGVAPKCRLMPLRINLTSGMNANRADALNYVVDQAKLHKSRRYVINCSWRASGSFSAILHAIDNAVAYNVPVVFAAGNGSRDMDSDPPQFPGAHESAICVAAVNSKDKRPGFSNVGSQVDVSAPGTNVLSTVPGNDYSFMDGTSMAAPHVAGVIALMLSVDSELRVNEIRRILAIGCDDLIESNPELVGKLGSGRVNAAKCVQIVEAAKKARLNRMAINFLHRR